MVVLQLKFGFLHLLQILIRALFLQFAKGFSINNRIPQNIRSYSSYIMNTPSDTDYWNILKKAGSPLGTKQSEELKLVKRLRLLGADRCMGIIIHEEC